MQVYHYPERMEKIISMVTHGNRVCDVGCDHGYVSIGLIERGISPSALAMDINKGPLDRAKEHIRERGLDNDISVRLSNGLIKYNIGEADTLIIAGMGGPLICDILSENWNNTRDFKELILSPQSKIPEFRSFLYDNGYTIVDEQMVFEDGKYYVIEKVVPMVSQSLTEFEAYLGPVLLKDKPEIFRDYIEFRLKVVEDILCKLGDSNKVVINKPEVDGADGLKAEGEKKNNRLGELENERRMLLWGLKQFATE